MHILRKAFHNIIELDQVRIAITGVMVKIYKKYKNNKTLEQKWV